MSEKLLSVVIPTYNRKKLLGEVLDSLAKIEADFSQIEVIIVDDGSNDGTEEAVARRQDPFEIHVVKNEISQGPSAARNIGVSSAQGEIIGFVDSDVIVQQDWWKSAAPHFNRPEVAAVEGATLLPEHSEIPTPFTHFVHNNKGQSYQTCNLFCRKAVFEKVGGFDQRYCWRDKKGKLWHIREDTDLAFAFFNLGLEIVFEPQAIVLHPLFAAPRMVYFHKAYYGSREVLLQKKYPELYKKYLNFIDGRAFPVFYWGIFLGAPLVIAFTIMGQPLLMGLASIGWLMGWWGSVYAICRKRKVSFVDLITLLLQHLVIPWLRLFWVTQGTWQFRKIKPYST